MPRAARLHYPGGIFHIVSRCLNREYLLDGETERAYYIALLGRVLSRTDHRVLAWCLMSNHVHLVVEAGEAPLARLMKPLHTGYAVWKNTQDGRLGPVFAERYRSILVERDAHLDELVRYVHLNPVRAGVVTSPEASRWTSHRAYLGADPCPVWLDIRVVLSRFARDAKEALPLSATSWARLADLICRAVFLAIQGVHTTFQATHSSCSRVRSPAES
jgi:putative transposase